VLYVRKVGLLKRERFNRLWRRWRVYRGGTVGAYHELPSLIREHAPGRSFVDIGCMWGVDGEYAFVAEEAGAAPVRAVDVFGPTPAYEKKHKARGSKVEFILGDASHPDTIERLGVMDVVFCAGVLYHHPSPFDLLVALRRVCRQLLILRTSTIPEIKGLPNAAVYFPMLRDADRRLWDLSSLGLLRQVGISDPFNQEAGYGNWFWGLSPSCLQSLLKTAGFDPVWRATEAFAQTVLCTPSDKPFVHRLPGEEEARALGARIEKAGIAKPA
jgi:hypothetical protein